MHIDLIKEPSSVRQKCKCNLTTAAVIKTLKLSIKGSVAHFKAECLYPVLLYFQRYLPI